ncbi:MAG: AEC family transporter [Candidatus Faecousia sp.]|nr:AEC family transporter [Candidatus Faecousia sp.]
MENFTFALNATIPVFLVIALGYILQRVHFLNDAFNKTANEFVFRCALPVSLFRSIAGMDFYGEFDLEFCLFCFLGTTAMFLGIWAAAWLFMKDRGQVGAFSQASARSSAAVLGIALAVNIYGDAGMVPMMIMSAVPFFNVYSVLILSFSPQVDEEGHLLPAARGLGAVKKACVNVAKNPLILGILAGLPFALLRVKVPVMLDSALSSIGATATPIALLVVGASFSGGEAVKHWRGAVVSSLVKLFLLPGIFLPLAAMLGFRNSQMIAILIMTGSPTTVASFVMAKNMHADGVLTANAVLLSTVLSAVSITIWLYLMKTIGWV